MIDELLAYIDDGFVHVEGWVDQTLWEALVIINDIQLQHNVEGGVAEIGVHHGRLLLGLQALKAPVHTALAIDVFDAQEQNIDNSGIGSKTAFDANVDKYSVSPEDVHAIAGDSLMLRGYDVARIRENYGRFSMFDVDGGHTAEHVFHDFQVAQELTSPGGVILIDDYNNPWWPGVHEGVAKAYHTISPTFVPLLHGMNKLILTDIGHHAIYFKAIVEYFSKFPIQKSKITERYGWNCLSLALPQKQSNFAEFRTHKTA